MTFGWLNVFNAEFDSEDVLAGTEITGGWAGGWGVGGSGGG